MINFSPVRDLEDEKQISVQKKRRIETADSDNQCQLSVGDLE
jgi:hypothetical protein